MLYFPHPFTASEDGLLAIGGDLSVDRLIFAYQYGIYPWYSYPPVMWWFTSPRCVLLPGQIHISKNMKRLISQKKYKVTTNHAFEEVIYHCSQSARKGQAGTWITPEMSNAYCRLHRLGYAHSVEVWENSTLIGGLYGVAIGKIFSGESMFAKKSNASKLAFIIYHQYLFEHGFWLVDCQQENDHLSSLGASMISKEAFWEILSKNRIENSKFQLSTRKRNILV